jgi:hypothetical protein
MLVNSRVEYRCFGFIYKNAAQLSGKLIILRDLSQHLTVYATTVRISCRELATVTKVVICSQDISNRHVSPLLINERKLEEKKFSN